MREHAVSAALLGEHARQRLDGIVDDLMERQWHEVPELWVTDDPALREAVLRSTRENTELLLRGMCRPMGVPRELPAGARLEADVTAQCGAGIDALLRSYHVTQPALTEHFLDAIESGVVDDPAQAIGQLRSATQRISGYLGAVMPLVAREHAAERVRMEASPDLRRLRLVQAALAGDSSVVLDYELATVHVALVLADAHAEDAVAAAARGLGVAWLSVRGPDGRCWAWLATDDATETASRLRAAGTDGPAGLGGPAGFRDAHRQAMLAERIARSRRAGLVDVRAAVLEALALGDQRMAAEVARAELGPLAAEPRHEQLVRTLEAWFAARESVSGAASTLGVAPRTVSYRLRRAEALLGHPIAARRAELEAALRLQRLFAGGPPQP